MNIWRSIEKNRNYEANSEPLSEAEKMEWQFLDENTAEDYLLPKHFDESGNKLSGKQTAYYSPFANQEDEGGRIYPDAWGSERLQNGKIVYQLSSGGNTPSSYFTDEETVDSCRDPETGKIDIDVLKRKLQIEDVGHEKNVLTAYIVNNSDGLKAGRGVAEENPQYGAGGGRQYFIPYAGNYKEDGNLQKVGELQNIDPEAHNRDTIRTEDQKGQRTLEPLEKRDAASGQEKPQAQDRGGEEPQEFGTGQEKQQNQEDARERPGQEQEDARERPVEGQGNPREKNRDQKYGREEPYYSENAERRPGDQGRSREESQDFENAGDRARSRDHGHEETQGPQNVRERPRERENAQGESNEHDQRRPQERENAQGESNEHAQGRPQERENAQKEPEGHNQARTQEDGERPDTGYDYYYGYGY